MEVEEYTPRLLLESPGPRLRAREIAELDEVGIYDPNYPHRDNGFTHSEELKQLYAQQWVLQAAFNEKASHTIPDAMSYLGRNADSTVEWNYDSTNRRRRTPVPDGCTD